MQNREITYYGKSFIPYIKHQEIDKCVAKVAEEINKRYKEHSTEDKAPIFLSVLNGAFMYTSDLMKHIDFPCEIQFVKLSSYSNTNSTGEVTEVFGITTDLEGRDIIIIDDIADTGLTLLRFIETLKSKNPASIAVSVFIHKPHTCSNDLVIDYPCIKMNESKFIIGYGLDFNQMGRNLSDVYILSE